MIVGEGDYSYCLNSDTALAACVCTQLLRNILHVLLAVYTL